MSASANPLRAEASELEPPRFPSSPATASGQPTLAVLWRLLPLLSFAFAASVVVLRFRYSGLQNYGMGAQYIEHAARLSVLMEWRAQPEFQPFEFLVGADTGYPPLLHVLTLLGGAVFGSGLGAVNALGTGWILLLGIGVGVCAGHWARSRRCGSLAASVAMLLPAVPAVATHYYYDLPMAAMLWLAMACLLSLRTAHPVLASVSAGLAWTAAALLKWSALPFGLVAALAVTRSRREIPATLVSLLFAGVLLLAFVAQADGSITSLAGGLLPPEDIEKPSRLWLFSALPEPFASAFSRPLRQLGLLTPGFLAFYPLTLVTSILSPAAALVVLPLSVLGLIRVPSLRWPSLVLLGGGTAFCALWIHVQDERLLLSLVPVLGATTAAGLLTLRARRVRRPLLLLVFLVLATVSLDFHFGSPSPLNTARELLFVPYRGVHVVARGLGLATSESGIGWRRRDEQLDDRAAYREVVWRHLAAEGVASVGTVPHAPLFGPDGDEPWLEYRSRYAVLFEDASPLRFVQAVSGESSPELLLVRAVDSGWANLPPDAAPGEWRRPTRIPAADGGVEIEFWSHETRGPPRLPGEQP